MIVGIAALDRRQIRALAKSELFGRPLGWVLHRMGQLPITRGCADAGELTATTDVLRAGGCVGIFPEGGISKGQRRRAYSGAGWLARTVPASRVVAVAITGAVEIARFPARPRITVEFFEPVDGPLRAGESSIGLSRRVLADIRARAPVVTSSRPRGPARSVSAPVAAAPPLSGAHWRYPVGGHLTRPASPGRTHRVALTARPPGRRQAGNLGLVECDSPGTVDPTSGVLHRGGAVRAQRPDSWRSAK